MVNHLLSDDFSYHEFTRNRRKQSCDDSSNALSMYRECDYCEERATVEIDGAFRCAAHADRE